MDMMSPVPSATLPQDESEYRFHETGYPCEWVEKYRPGWLHPVNLGDTFKGRRYRVIRKLGYGSFSTVWLARDTTKSGYVALKVMDASASRKSATELSILERINEHRSEDLRTQYILTTLDTFQHSGPNGTHLCLVSEPMGPTVSSLAEELTPLEEWKPNISYPKHTAKRILRHTLLGLSFLHDHGIVHADLQPGNLLSSISNIDQLSEEDLQQDLSGDGRHPAPEEIRRLDGLQDELAPRNLYLGQSLVKYVKRGQEMQVKISDFGAAFWEQESPGAVVTPIALRAPELILHGKLGAGIDIWSFGCLIFELLTGQPLFSVFVLHEDEREETDDDHLLQMNDILEALPDSWLEGKWPRARTYFSPGGERIGPPSATQDGPYIEEPLEVKFKEYKSDDIDDGEADVITSLIRRILKYEPSQRPTAGELLKHAWFQE